MTATGTILAHVEAAHAHGAGQVLRLGPLLPLGLVAVIAAGRADPDVRLRRVGAVALGAAGLLHVVLFPEHQRESAAAGAFFLTSSVAEGALALALLVSPARWLGRAAVGVAAGLLVVYVDARIVRLPLTSGRESIDAVGLVTKTLEVAGATCAWLGCRGPGTRRRRVPSLGPFVAVGLGALALVARPVFGEGPASSHALVALAAGLAVAGLSARTGRPIGWASAVSDGAAIALLLRAPAALTYVGIALVAAGIRTGARRLLMPAAPLALALAVAFAVGRLHGRLEVLHVGHPSEAWPALLLFVTAALLSLAAWERGRLPVAIAFLGAHVGAQALRWAGGRTSLEAIEIPAASLGLFLIAVVVLADPDLRLSPSVQVVVGLMAGALDAALRDAAVPYAPVLAVVTVTAIVAAWCAWRELAAVPARVPESRP